MRSWDPLPSRTTIFEPSKSMSLTRNWTVSSTRKPDPYCSRATIDDTPVMAANARLTSSRDITEGNRPGRFAHHVQAIEPSAEHCVVEEQEGTQRLVLGRSRNLAVYCQMGQEGVDFRLAHGPGAADAMEDDEPSAPVVVGVLSPATVMAHSAGMAQAVEELRLGGIWGRGRHGRIRGGVRVLGAAQFPAPAWPVYVGGSLPERRGTWGYQFSRSQLLSRTPWPSEM